MKRMLLVFTLAAGTMMATGRGSLAAVVQMTPRGVGATDKANWTFIPRSVRTLFLRRALRSEPLIDGHRRWDSHRFSSPTFRSHRSQMHIFSRGMSGRRMIGHHRFFNLSTWLTHHR